MRKTWSIVLILVSFILSGCEKQYEYYTHNIVGPFDTITTYIAYAKSEDEFNQQVEIVEQQLNFYHQLFDQYHNYENLNNLKTINDYAGKQAVQVDQVLIDLLDISIQRYETISPKVNIALGSVIKIWHNYRENAQNHHGVGNVPTLQELNKANEHTDIKSIIIDKEKKTVYINDSEVSIDLGATAKGYAIELVKQKLIDYGVESFLISGGGNVASYGERLKPKDGDFSLSECAQKYCVGIQSPLDGNYSHQSDDSAYENEAILVVQDESIVTSGDYQRFYEDIQGIKYHHLIDPDTLFPADTHIRSVSIITKDSGYADFLSSAVFMMDYEDGFQLINSLDDVEAIWLLEDGKIRYSQGLHDNQEFYVINKERIE